MKQSTKPSLRKRQTIGHWFAIGALAATLVSCTISVGPAINDKGPQLVTYHVLGTASSSSIAYNNQTEGMDQVKSGRNTATGEMSWAKAVTLHAGQFAYITAQNDDSKGSVVVEIFVKGRLVRRSESSGEYCIATASYTVGSE